MEERRNNIDEFFRRSMGSHAEAPPPAVWEQLEQRLDRGPGGGRKRPFPFWWIGAISVVVMVSATILIAGNLMSDSSTAITETVEGKPQPSAPANEATNAEIAEANTVPAPEAQVQENIMSLTEPTYYQQKQTTTSSDIPATKPASLVNTNNNNYQKTENNNDNSIAQASEKRRTEPKTNALPVRSTSVSEVLSSSAPVAHSPAGTAQLSAQGRLRTSEPDAEVIQPADATAIQVPAATNFTVVTAPQPLYAAALPSSLFEAEPASNATATEEVEIMPASTVVSNVSMEDTSKKKKLLKKADTSILNDTEQEVVTNDPKKVKTKKTRTGSGKLPIEAGIKLGFSKGFNSTWRADRWVVAPYAEYRLPYNFSLAVQPAYSTGNINKGALQFTDKSYHEITGNTFDSTRRVATGHIDSSVLTPNPPDTVFYTYRYGQTYDSVQVSYTSKQNKLWEVEIPLILKYRINRNLTVFAGASATISSVVETVETVDRYSGLSKAHIQEANPQTYQVTQPNQAPPPGPQKLDHASLFTYGTDPFSMFTPVNMQSTNAKTLTRYGYMVGATATFKDRWMIDVMMHKSGVDATIIPDKNIQKLYTQPYFRIMVGYKLIK